MHDSLKTFPMYKAGKRTQITSYIGSVLLFRAKGKRLSEIDRTCTAVITT